VTIDLRELGRVLEVDKISRAARIEAGAFGPALEAQLKPHGLTPSVEHSKLCGKWRSGWIATRSGGHFATLYTHIDDLVESLRVITPMGVIETRRLPGSGAAAPVNVMAQFHPDNFCDPASDKYREKYDEIARRPTHAELHASWQRAYELGLKFETTTFERGNALGVPAQRGA
jgi:hypothetical protein